jgi:hypothetical protein
MEEIGPFGGRGQYLQCKMGMEKFREGGKKKSYLPSQGTYIANNPSRTRSKRERERERETIEKKEKPREAEYIEG